VFQPSLRLAQGLLLVTVGDRVAVDLRELAAVELGAGLGDVLVARFTCAFQ